MVRYLLAAAAALSLLGASRPDVVQYRLGLSQPRGGAPVAHVEIRFRGDADGETRLDLPDHYGGTHEAWRYLFKLKIKGAKVSEDGPGVRVLRHKPGAKITVRYDVQSAYREDPKGADGNAYRGPILRPGWFSLLGEFVFATPEGRDRQAATFAWGRLPRGWRAASDLEHVGMGRWMSVDDVVQSISIGAPDLALVERQIPGGTLRLAAPGPAAAEAASVADAVTPIVAAQRGFWGDVKGPYFIGVTPLAPEAGAAAYGSSRGDGFALYIPAMQSAAGAPGVQDALKPMMAREHKHTWIPGRVGRTPNAGQAPDDWLSEGFTDFFAIRTGLRGGLISPEQAAQQLDDTLQAYEASARHAAPDQRGSLLALKWDEEIRQKTGGKADLDTVIRQMRDHYQKFPPGQGPDVTTGLVSAAWVVAQIDLRPEIDRYAVKGELVELPEDMFGGCLYIRTNRRPTFDAGLDLAASTAAKALKGVQRGGPAWLAGLRNGQKVDGIDAKAGDTQRQITVKVRDKRGRTKSVVYWPYGDAFSETHDLKLKPSMKPAELAACGKKMGGL
jgi:predicted metalloprotease with PDZ domain